MSTTVSLVWALLFAAPVFSQQTIWADPQLSQDGIHWFGLYESQPEVRALLGQPAMVAEFGEYRSWQYQIGVADHDDFSHALVFRKSDGKLVSISRSYNPERQVDMLFPDSETAVYWYRAEGQPDFPMRIRRLSGGRVLMAVGISKAGQPTGQIVLILESELPHFYAWLADRIKR